MNKQLNVQGAIDLGALAKARESQKRAAEQPQGSNGFVIDVNMSNFERDVIQQSMSVPVVVDLWATWCQPCKQLSPVLEKLAADYAGRFVLVKIDIDANPELAQAFQVQSIPMVLAFVGGQPLGLFQGALPESQIRPVLDQVLAAAAQAGVNGVATPREGLDQRDSNDDKARDEEVPTDPRFDAAEAAIDAGDWEAAKAAYAVILKETPNDAVARIGLLNVELMQRTENIDFDVAIANADDSIDAQLQQADALFLMGEYDQAFQCLVEIVRRESGDDRNRAKERLLALFEIAGPTHESVPKARLALSNALF